MVRLPIHRTMNPSGTSAIVVGQHLGPYRIDRVLGAGGMGVVYLAEDRDLRRKVAIKVVDRSRHGEEATRLLLEEARVTAALNHPSICGVHEVGRLGDERFIVMEHVDGVSCPASSHANAACPSKARCITRCRSPMPSPMHISTALRTAT